MKDNMRFENKLQTLQRDYKKQLPERLRAITNDWGTLCDVTWNPRLLERLITRIHSIAGSAGSFGFAQLSRKCQSAEQILIELRQQQSLPSVTVKRNISQIIDEFYEHSGLEEDAPLIVEQGSSLDLKLLIVDDEAEYAQLVSLICEQWGCETEILTDLAHLSSRLTTYQPDLVLIDIVFPEGGFAGIHAVKKIHDSLGLKIPVIFMSSRNDLDARLKAMRAGGEAYLTKPIDPVELKSLLDRLRIQKANYASVLIVDDDKTLTRAYSYMLEDFGFETFVCNDPTDVIRQVEKHSPNLVLLDLNMPKIKGNELIRLFKQDPKYMHIPLVMMTADARDETRIDAMNAGATDFIVKPFEPEDLAAKVRNVIVKTNAMQQLIKQVTKEDLSKNISNRQHFMGTLQEVLQNGLIRNTPAALVQMTTRNLEYLRHKAGLSRLEQANHQLINRIKARLEPDELMTEIADLTVLMLVKNTSPEATRERLTNLMDELNERHLNVGDENIALDCCCGFYSLSRSGRHIDDILNEVENAAFNATTTPETDIVFCRSTSTSDTSDPHDRDIELALENLQVNLIYQPIINMERHEKKYEAYARINDRNNTPLPPSDFMGHIDSRGLHNEFNQAVTYSAIEELNQQAEQGATDIQLIIKLATSHFTPLNYLVWMSKVLNATPVYPGQRLIISIPEEYTLRQRRAALRLITGIKDMACGLMLDKVGLSDNSMAILTEFNPQLVKLDRKVIEKLLAESTEEKRNVCALLDQGITVIAPYVETAASFASLWDMGIRNFQGFFVQKPQSGLNFDFSQQSEQH